MSGIGSFAFQYNQPYTSTLVNPFINKYGRVRKLQACKLFNDGYHCKIDSKDETPDGYMHFKYEGKHYYLVPDDGSAGTTAGCIGPYW